MNPVALLKLLDVARKLYPLVKAAIPLLIAGWGIMVDAHNGNANVTTSLVVAGAAKVAADVHAGAAKSEASKVKAAESAFIDPYASLAARPAQTLDEFHASRQPAKPCPDRCTGPVDVEKPTKGVSFS